MQKKSAPADILREMMKQLLPPEGSYEPVVQTEHQLKQLEVLTHNIPNESFYFVFNLLSCKIDIVKGVKEWLGYPDKEFTVNRYLALIYPGQSLMFNLIAHNMYRILCNGVFKLKFGKQRYVSFVALKHYNGQYIVFKKTTTVFQYDKKNRLLAQLNEFTKIGLYEGDPLKPRISESEGLQADDFERVIFQMCLKTFMEKKYFSVKEFEVLQSYAEDKDISRIQLAGRLAVEVTTIDTLNKRILEKARATFTNDFNSVKEVSLYLKKEKIL